MLSQLGNHVKPFIFNALILLAHSASCFLKRPLKGRCSTSRPQIFALPENGPDARQLCRAIALGRPWTHRQKSGGTPSGVKSLVSLLPNLFQFRLEELDRLIQFRCRCAILAEIGSRITIHWKRTRDVNAGYWRDESVGGEV